MLKHAGLVLSTVVLLFLATGCGNAPENTTTKALPSSTVSAPTSATTATTEPCGLSATPGTANTVPVDQVCPAAGAPHFGTPEAAMSYLANAWNADNVRELDYVTDPAGRAQMDSMATLMVNLRFKYCAENPAGDYTCYFSHDIAPASSETTYPNPMGYPPGEAVFTVAPAETPGWYLTEVIHCG
ncbi:MAG: hypothetical protein ACLQRH_05560 [Acidimicrobiales bacterium]